MDTKEAERRVKAFIENREIIGTRAEYEEALSTLKAARIDQAKWMPNRNATAADFVNRRMT